MAEIDLPASGGASAGEAQLGKFLATLGRLVEILGHTGPGGDTAGGTSPAQSAVNPQSKQLIAATRRLFSDMANAFKPLKAVLASFSSLQAPKPAEAPLLATPGATTATPTAAEDSAAPNLQSPKYDKYFKAEQFSAFRQPVTERETPASPPPAAPPKSGTGLPNLAALQIAQAEVRIASASVTGSTTERPEPKGAPNAAKPTSASAPAAAPTKIIAQTAELKATSVSVYGKQAKDEPAPAAPSAPAAAPTANPPATPTLKSPAAKTAKIIQTASFKVGNALLQGKLLLPPTLTLKANQVTVQGKQSASAAPPSASAPASSAPKSPSAPPPAATPTPPNLQSAVLHIASAVIHANTGPAPANASAPAPAANSAPAAASPAAGGAGKMASMFSALARGMQDAAKNLATGALEAGKKMASLVGSGVAAPIKAAHRVVGNVGEKLTMAFNDPIGAMQSFGRLMIGFVEVVNPAAVMHFNKALKDISAIIGIVLAPAMTILTEVAREFGNLMAPIAKQIAPIFTELARTIGDLLMAQIRTFATYLQVLMPIIKSLMIIFGGLARIATAINEGFMVFLSGFLGSFNGLDDMVRKVVDGIVDFVKMLVRYTLVAVAMVAKLFGATEFIEKMRKAAAGKGPEKEDTTGLANPTNANFTAAESFGKSIATASFTATSAASAPKKTDDFLEDIAKDMEAIAGMDMKQVIIEAIEASVPALARAIAGGTVETIKSAGNTAYEYTGLPWAGRKLGNFAAGLMGYETD